ncbi:TetR family transcriptional regulator [Mycobacterium sp. IS-1496]|uniref:TetR family transcriptional regulator n=1 Tax=Mycobacterium sp. IS-1496 TaxID=1772284 RepID=UPI000741729E|nr:TetR family transcriptional regulator [Mycobacterium sp. IS-1496]KUI31536.1 TetR family transcriptional regulator [Mycobacterium sp. IS-1496]
MAGPVDGASAGSEARMIAVVIEILETDGYEAVQLREVARRARISLSTIYKRYATRDELILAALEAWMDDHRYSGVSPHPREPGASLHQALMDLFRTIFEPWEQHPGMLTAYYRARSSQSGRQLMQRGLDIVVPAGLELLSDVDDEFVADFSDVIFSVVYGLLGRFTTGEITITEILPTLDRAVFWLTTGYEAAKGSGAAVHARDVR